MSEWYINLAFWLLKSKNDRKCQRESRNERRAQKLTYCVAMTSKTATFPLSRKLAELEVETLQQKRLHPMKTVNPPRIWQISKPSQRTHCFQTAWKNMVGFPNTLAGSTLGWWRLLRGRLLLNRSVKGLRRFRLINKYFRLLVDKWGRWTHEKFNVIKWLQREDKNYGGEINEFVTRMKRA